MSKGLYIIDEANTLREARYIIDDLKEKYRDKIKSIQYNYTRITFLNG